VRALTSARPASAARASFLCHGRLRAVTGAPRPEQPHWDAQRLHPQVQRAPASPHGTALAARGGGPGRWPLWSARYPQAQAAGRACQAEPQHPRTGQHRWRSSPSPCRTSASCALRTFWRARRRVRCRLSSDSPPPPAPPRPPEVLPLRPRSLRRARAPAAQAEAHDSSHPRSYVGDLMLEVGDTASGSPNNTLCADLAHRPPNNTLCADSVHRPPLKEGEPPTNPGPLQALHSCAAGPQTTCGACPGRPGPAAARVCAARRAGGAPRADDLGALAEAAAPASQRVQRAHQPRPAVLQRRHLHLRSVGYGRVRVPAQRRARAGGDGGALVRAHAARKARARRRPAVRAGPTRVPGWEAAKALKADRAPGHSSGITAASACALQRLSALRAKACRAAQVGLAKREPANADRAERPCPCASAGEPGGGGAPAGAPRACARAARRSR